MLVSKGSDALELQLKQGTNRIGRNPSNDFQVQDISISGTHCEVIVELETVRVRDLNSTNGTFIDEMPVRESLLRDGQTLRLGNCAFCFVPDATGPVTNVRLRASAPKPPPAPPDTPNDLPLPPVHTAVEPCANHANVAAAFVCRKCGGYFCGSCVNEQTIAHRKLRFCRTCGEDCRSLREPPPKIKKQQDFYELLPKAFVYPFKRDGLILLVTGTVFFGLLNALVGGPVMGGFFAGGYVVILRLFALGYLISYMKAIVAVSAYGEDEMPKWPDFSDFYDDIMHPILLFFASALLCFAPVLVYMWYVDYDLPGWETFWYYTLWALGFAAMPICLLATFLHETVFALNPLVLVVTIFRVPIEYLVLCVVLAMLFACRLLVKYVALQTDIVPVIPSFVDGFLSLYFLAVEMRIIGLLFNTRRKKLRWAMS
jgi:hypothetical protein